MTCAESPTRWGAPQQGVAPAPRTFVTRHAAVPRAAPVYGTCDVCPAMRTTPRLVLVLVLGTACHVDSLFTSPRQPSAGFGLGALSQFQSDSTTTIPLGGSATSASIVVAAVVADSDTTEAVRLQVELHPVATAFTGQATSQSALVQNGARAYVLESGLADNTAY